MVVVVKFFAMPYINEIFKKNNLPTDAIVKPFTMVIKVRNTSITLFAVFTIV